MRFWSTYFFLPLLAVLVSVTGCDTERNTEDPDISYFMKYYGGDGNQYGVDMVVLDDGSFLLLGNFEEATFNTDLYLLRVNAEGDLIWDLRIGEEEEVIWKAKDIEPTPAGDFVVLAEYQVDVGEQTDLVVFRVSADGAVLKTSGPFGTIANDYARSITPVDDGSFIVSGTTELTGDYGNPSVPNPDVGDFFNFRLDADLNLWPETDWGPSISGFGGRQDVAVKAIPFLYNPPGSPDGPKTYFYVFGHSKSVLFDSERMGLFYFLRADHGGESANFYPGRHPADTQINFVLQAAPQFGGGFVVVGTTQDNFGNSSIFAARLASSLTFQDFNRDVPSFYGSLLLGRNTRGVAAANSVAGEPGFLIVGDELRGTGASNIWLSKIDQSGAVMWSTTIGSQAENDMAAAVHELPDGRIVIFGTMGLANKHAKMALIKVNRRGRFLK